MEVEIGAVQSIRRTHRGSGCTEVRSLVGIVGNDAAWGQMMRPQAMLYGHGAQVTEPDQIRPALERAFESGKPALVNVEMRKDVGAMKGSTYV